MKLLRSTPPAPAADSGDDLVEVRRLVAGECFEHTVPYHPHRIFMKLNADQHGKVRAVDLACGTMFVLSSGARVRQCSAEARVC